VIEMHPRYQIELQRCSRPLAYEAALHFASVAFAIWR
jgi:hypothetical protein